MSTRGRNRAMGENMGRQSSGASHTQSRPRTLYLRPRCPSAVRCPRPPLATNNEQLATTQCKNTKTNPPPTPAFPQAPTNTSLKKTPPLPALPNQGEKAVSRQDQPTQNPDQN